MCPGVVGIGGGVVAKLGSKRDCNQVFGNVMFCGNGGVVFSCFSLTVTG